MDEVDGMSAGDRGGVGALNAMIKKSKVNTMLRINVVFRGWLSTLGPYHMYREWPTSPKNEASDSYNI